MKILHDHHQRLLGRVRRDQPVNRLEELTLLEARARAAVGVAQLRPEPGERGSRAWMKRVRRAITRAGREGAKGREDIIAEELREIMAEMGWLKHTTRAMLSAGGGLYLVLAAMFIMTAEHREQLLRKFAPWLGRATAEVSS